MAEFIPAMSRRPERNISYSDDGSVWVHYLLVGLNVNTFRPEQADSAQKTHELLYSALSFLPTDDIKLSGLLTRSDPMVLLQRIFGCVPDWDATKYAYFASIIEPFIRRVKSGEYAEKQRVFWLSISRPNRRTVIDRAVSQVAETDPHEGLKVEDINEFERACFEAIPQQFRPRRTLPEHLDWYYERATKRGLEIPEMPKERKPGDGPVVSGHKAYPQVDIDWEADSNALYSRFLKDIENLRPYVKTLDKLDTKKAFFTKFRTLRKGRIAKFSHPELRSPELPDGPTTYQSCVGIARYPTDYSKAVSSFTYLVDQALGVDADFTIRMRFSQNLVSADTAAEADKNLASETESNASNEFEAVEFVEKRSNVRDWHAAVRARPGARGMQIATIFAFAHPDIDYLSGRIASLVEHFKQNDFTPIVPVGGQKELWTMMMPGSARTSLGDDLLQTSTTHWFSGAIPIRRSFAGDVHGVPIAINKSNALGQIVLLDILNANKAGNASIAITGAQGGGKSNLMKLLFIFLMALNRYGSVIDHSTHGEWGVIGRRVARVNVVQCGSKADQSVDPLKNLPSPFGENVLRKMYSQLFDLDRYSEEFRYLNTILEPQYRKHRKIESTRDLIEYLRTDYHPEAQSLFNRFDYWSKLPEARAFIDPEPTGPDDRGLPPFDDLSDLVARMDRGDTPHATIFRTQELPVFRSGNKEDWSDINHWAAAAYGAIASMTAIRFSMIRDICGFFGDEMSFLEGNQYVLDTLIRAQDRVGRKEGNFAVVASQAARDLESEFYGMIKRKAILRQETVENSAEALRWGDMPVLDSLITQHVSDTSPTDPEDSTLTIPGRYGEGWWNDGSNIVRVQFLPILQDDFRRFADTTVDKMIRESEDEGHDILVKAG